MLKVANDSIEYGMHHKKPLPVKPSEYSNELQQERGTFVTLHLNGQLRGCIGTLEARLPLIADVAKNAFLSAFQDPRFQPLSPEAFKNIDLEISVLSEALPMRFTSESDLLEQLRPGIDGLILSDNQHRGTFLPTVWEQLPEPRDFLDHLKNKAGLPTGYWSDTIKIERYTSELIS